MAEPLKDLLYNPQFFNDLVAVLQRFHPSFDGEGFLAHIYDDQWVDRPLKQRTRHTTMMLHEFLPPTYQAAISVLKDAAPLLGQYSFQLTCFSDFVELYGQDDWETSLPAMEWFTQFSSAEFAVRPFILQNPERMMEQMRLWAAHESHHVRRLASEGSRPRLPWAMALPMFKRDSTPILPILECLKDDPSEYVRRSVANNLNDIGKDNPAVVKDVLRRWQPDANADRMWIIQRALRSLIKAGDVDALNLLGYEGGADIEFKNLTVQPATIRIGETLTFSFDIESQSDAPQSLMIDYVVHFMKANGSLAPKVFKLTKKTINPGETLHFEKRHSFKLITTRKYYPGEHAFSLKINGAEFGNQRFTLAP